MRILVVDDEREMSALLARGLAADGHEAETAANGVEALTLVREKAFEVAVVDLMMPGMSGFELCRWLKRQDPQMVVILLTARDAVDDRIRGLDEGADDYMTKPFSLAELTARIRAIRRRDTLSPRSSIRLGDVDLDLLGHTALVAGEPLALSRTEFDVLRVLAAAGGELVPRAQLFEEVWGSSRHIDPNVLDQYISYLRRKLSSRKASTHIATLRGEGYCLISSAAPCGMPE